MSDEQALLQDFNASQRRRNTIMVTIGALALGSLIAARIYSGYKRAEVHAEMEALDHYKVRAD